MRLHTLSIPHDYHIKISVKKDQHQGNYLRQLCFEKQLQALYLQKTAMKLAQIIIIARNNKDDGTTPKESAVKDLVDINILKRNPPSIYLNL